jgi:hypothetical protein
MAAFDDQHDDAQVDVSQFEPELDSISKGARVPALHGLEVSDVEPDVVKAGSSAAAANLRLAAVTPPCRGPLAEGLGGSMVALV